MLSPLWIERFLKIPGAKQVKQHLKRQGHTEDEANIGAVTAAGLVIFLMALLFNSFLFGVLLATFNQFQAYCRDNGTEAMGIGIFSTALFLALVFQYLRKSTALKAEAQRKAQWDRHKIEEKRDYLRRGAMGNFEEIFRFYLSEKHPGIEVKTVHVVGTIPRIRFQARRFNSQVGEKVEKNYQLFRDSLFADTLHVMETAFGLSGNIPSVMVDAMMNFISGKAKYYDGAVLSVKAQRDVFEHFDLSKAQPFKVLTSFDLRYRDGMEVQPLPEEENKNARVLERIKERAPKLNVHYAAPKTKVDDGWEKPVLKEEGIPLQETTRGKELSSLPLAQFQDLVTGFLAKMSFEVLKVKKVPGGTLQIQADFRHPVVGGSFLILARQYPETAPVHADLVRELDELAREEACKRGVYIITGRFTEEARNITRKMAVDLVDGALLSALLEGPAYDGRWSIRTVDEKGVATDLSRMPLMNFERETDLFLKSMGFRVEKIRRMTGGAVVAVAEFPHPVTGGKFAVMARQFPPEERVSAEIVSELTHVMTAEFCYRGLLMVPSDYAMEARALSRFSGVELVDRNTWENLRRHM